MGEGGVEIDMEIILTTSTLMRTMERISKPIDEFCNPLFTALPEKRPAVSIHVQRLICCH